MTDALVWGAKEYMEDQRAKRRREDQNEYIQRNYFLRLYIDGRDRSGFYVGWDGMNIFRVFTLEYDYVSLTEHRYRHTAEKAGWRYLNGG